MAAEKPRATITVDPKYLEWIDERIADKRFANRSHAFEYAVQKLMEDSGTGITRRTRKMKPQA
jgi:Arc/MetJ-type ribon-helix-helix transcriptional regulator